MADGRILGFLLQKQQYFLQCNEVVYSTTAWTLYNSINMLEFHFNSAHLTTGIHTWSHYPEGDKTIWDVINPIMVHVYYYHSSIVVFFLDL